MENAKDLLNGEFEKLLVEKPSESQIRSLPTNEIVQLKVLQDEHSQKMVYRKYLTIYFSIILGIWLLFVMLIVAFNYLPASVSITLLGTATANIIVLPYTVAKYVFHCK